MKLLLLLGVLLSLLFVLLGLKLKITLRNRKARRSSPQDYSLWTSLTATFFEPEQAVPADRIKSALAAMARKLQLRGGMAILQTPSSTRILAVTGSDYSLVGGLAAGDEIQLASVYCSSLPEKGQALTIDYASLSEWRRHRAFRERGWESYIGACGISAHGSKITVAFFDSVPRDQLFSFSEKALVEQLVPWIALVVEEGFSEQEPVRTQERAIFLGK
jgi:hypothetical protein